MVLVLWGRQMRYLGGVWSISTRDFLKKTLKEVLLGP
jgi:hypothetical protein